MFAAVGASLSVDELNKELVAMRARFDNWSQSQLLNLEQLKAKHLQNVNECKAAVSHLESRHQQLEQQAQEVRQRLEAEGRHIESLREQCAQYTQQHRQLPDYVNELKQVLEEESEQLHKKESALAKECAVSQKKLDSLQLVVDLYRTRLGLSIVHAEDDSKDLDIILTHIDPSDPQRQFMFAVRVGEDDQYHVTKCQPAVERLQEYVDALNNTQKSFATFVRAMRKEFRSMVGAGV